MLEKRNYRFTLRLWKKSGKSINRSSERCSSCKRVIGRNRERKKQNCFPRSGLFFFILSPTLSRKRPKKLQDIIYTYTKENFFIFFWQRFKLSQNGTTIFFFSCSKKRSYTVYPNKWSPILMLTLRSVRQGWNITRGKMIRGIFNQNKRTNSFPNGRGLVFDILDPPS